MKESLQRHKQYLLNGVSHVIPLIACGGILIATAIALVPMTETGPDFSQAPAFIKSMLTIGEAAFKIFPAVLAAFIAFGMAGKPGLAAGFIGGVIASLPQVVDGKSTSAGFLGAILAGLLAGHVVNLLKKLPLPRQLKPILPIIIIPIGSALPVGLVMLAVNLPLAQIMVGLQNWLEGMQGGSSVLLALILGGMIAFDMGGPVNKAAFFFGAALIQQGNYAVMGACAAAICTPPLGMALATFIGRKLWSEEERESGLAAFGMGMIGITEGAIPFAAADPLRVIPAVMAGSMSAAVIAMTAGVGNHAPHGGPIVLFVIDNKVAYLVAIAVGAVVSAVLINALKKFSQIQNPTESR